MTLTCPAAQDHCGARLQGSLDKGVLHGGLGDMALREERRRVVECADCPLACTAGAGGMFDNRLRLVNDLPTCVPQPPAEVSIFPVHPVLLIKASDSPE